MQQEAERILAFWREAGPQKWFGGGAAFDLEVKEHLLPAYQQAADRLLDHWQESAEGALARLILLDQVPRNMFRGTPRAFATDELALAGAEAAIAQGFDRAPEVERAPTLRSFFYLPLMHAEDEQTQARCVSLYREWGEENGLSHALIHHDAIARFGRFPHRNLILGRAMRAEEQAYLDEGGFSG